MFGLGANTKKPKEPGSLMSLLSETSHLNSLENDTGFASPSSLFTDQPAETGKQEDIKPTSSAHGELPIPTSPPPVLSEAYASRAKELIELNRKVRSLGGVFEFDLPRIAVIGSQSSGKSSLVEAISGISVPRDSGTCTRCPMECHMTRDEDGTWSSIIHLVRTECDARETALSTTRTQFGPEITDKNDLELWIRRAQAAILSPHRKETDFYGMSAEVITHVLKEDFRTVSFSKDTIEVEVRDPELVPLTFVDLPGLIQFHENPQTILTVQDLVRSFIGGNKRSNTLILIVIPMSGKLDHLFSVSVADPCLSDDINNQEAMKFAKEFDTEGLRTIGVLTKPDLITSGAIGSQVEWRNTLEGRGRYPLKHGYYCVRLPDDAERELRHPRAKSHQLAHEFFTTTAPWDAFPNRKLFGIPNLVSNVSSLLVELIESNLPSLRKEVTRLLKNYQKEFSELPEPPRDEPLVLLMLLLNKYSAEVQSAVTGETHRDLSQRNRVTYSRFKAALWATGIEFKPYIQDQPQADADVIRTLETREGFDSTATPEWERVKTPAFTQKMDVKDVRKVIHESIAWELPGHVPFRATEVLVERITCKWSRPAVACFDSVFNNMWNMLEKLIARHFDKYDALRELVRDLTRNEFEAHKKDALDALKSLVENEQRPLYTQNYENFQTERDQWRKRFTEASSGGYKPFNEEHRTEYHDELNLMGDVRAYFNVAFKRFIDVVPLLIENRLDRTFATNLPARLIGSIRVDDPEKLADIMAEKAVVRERRKTLKEYITRLSEIQALIGQASDDHVKDVAFMEGVSARSPASPGQDTVHLAETLSIVDSIDMVSLPSEMEVKAPKVMGRGKRKSGRDRA
ncbi:hypothetical protein VNI00_014046 [Paramarasmius palmivorus]|uniref:Uncharacterized protein n=1 Tax=Paramarasmius palmivorus TaxID=297713 RepID=A0AAW0BWL3_9AGAR